MGPGRSELRTGRGVYTIGWVFGRSAPMGLTCWAYGHRRRSVQSHWYWYWHWHIISYHTAWSCFVCCLLIVLSGCMSGRRVCFHLSVPLGLMRAYWSCRQISAYLVMIVEIWQTYGDHPYLVGYFRNYYVQLLHSFPVLRLSVYRLPLPSLLLLLQGLSCVSRLLI